MTGHFDVAETNEMPCPSTHCADLAHALDEVTTDRDETAARLRVAVEEGKLLRLERDLRRAANIVDAWIGPHEVTSADGLRAHADRLESAAAQADIVSDAITAASRAVMEWVDADASVTLLGFTPAMLAQIAVNAAAGLLRTEGGGE